MTQAPFVTTGRQRPPKSKLLSLWAWWRRLETVASLLILAGAVYLRAYVVLPAYVSSGSMEPTLLTGDFVMVNHIAYRRRMPATGDIVAFLHEGSETAGEDSDEDITPKRGVMKDGSEVWLKRVVGVPGDRVEVRRGVLYRNGQPVQEPYIHLKDDSYFEPVLVPSDCVFVMGDNRDNSSDSREWGPVPRDKMVGRIFLIYWPWRHFKHPK